MTRIAFKNDNIKVTQPLILIYFLFLLIQSQRKQSPPFFCVLTDYSVLYSDQMSSKFIIKFRIADALYQIKLKNQLWSKQTMDDDNLYNNVTVRIDYHNSGLHKEVTHVMFTGGFSRSNTLSTRACQPNGYCSV